MTLKVIGSGLGRTGTLSLKLALEQLGLGPCHHMVEVFMHPDSVPLWVAAGDGRPDWEAIFEGYASVVDYPGCRYWRALAAYYPEAKVLHTVRDPDAWFDSTQATIFAPASPASNPPPQFARFFEHMRSEFGANQHDRAFMTDLFRRHSAEVERTIPRERLLVWEVSQGWAPLCAFLGVEVPKTPFPRENSRGEFQARVQAVTGGAPSAELIREELEKARHGQ